MFLEISQNSQEHTCTRVSCCWPQACNFIKKETLAQVFPCEFSKSFLRIPFNRTPWTTASPSQKVVKGYSQFLLLSYVTIGSWKFSSYWKRDQSSITANVSFKCINILPSLYCFYSMTLMSSDSIIFATGLQLY